LVFFKIEIDYTGDREGFYLLKGEHGKWFEITDDLFPEDSDRFIYGYANHNYSVSLTNEWCTDRACSTTEWNAVKGRGFIKTVYPDGKKLIICLGRFKDEYGRLASGAFIGGNLPTSDPDSHIFDKNESGMAYFDSKKYYHIWCNVNEGFIADTDANTLISPTSWQFLDSKVLENSSTDYTLISRHKALVNNVPIAVERLLFYYVGDTYVILTTKLTNIGYKTSAFYYMYGDEPWIGNYGSSEGDIGWYKNGFITTERLINTDVNNYAGMFDYGNELAGEKHVYTNKANFIEWQHENRPDIAYFSNNFGIVGKANDKISLSSLTNRVIALQWGKFLLQPGQSVSFRIAVGMAGNDPRTGYPIKPDTGLN